MENKHCYNLADFIINKNIDEDDLKKLAELNQIEINIEIGWNRIILDLIIELNENGWNKKVTCIKEKYGELRFYTDSNFNDIIEKYTEKSLKTCIVCGDKGRKQYEGGYESIECNLHTFERRNKLSFFDKGFILNEKKYYWNIVNRIYTEEGYYDKEELHLKIEFKLKPFLKYFGWVNEYILIGTRSIGFRNFLLNIPTKLSDISNEYIEKFQKIEYCKICGYWKKRSN